MVLWIESRSSQMKVWGGCLLAGGLISLELFREVFPDVLYELGSGQLGHYDEVFAVLGWVPLAPSQLFIVSLILGFIPWTLSGTTKTESFLSKALRVEVTIIGIVIFLLSFAPGYGQFGHILTGYMSLGLSIAVVGAVSLTIRPRLKSTSAWKTYSLISHCLALMFLTPGVVSTLVQEARLSKQFYYVCIYALQGVAMGLVWGFLLILERKRRLGEGERREPAMDMKTKDSLQ